MSVAVLSTKLYVPPARANVIARPRLTEKLRAGMNRPGNIALLSGPAGFGKTTLLSEFVAQLRQPVAWVSLDEGDNDPIRFWTYLIAACQLVQEGIGESALALFRTPQPLPDDVIPTILINDLARLEEGLTLVLDDFHAIRNPAIHATMAFLLDHLPAGLHPVLSTRVDPPFPLARWRARNQLVEIRAQDLRFSVDEALEFLNHTMGLDLTTEGVSALEARTEGWIAGLQLAALSMQGRSDIPAFIQAFAGSHVYVADYLIEEILQRQPQNVQAFLLQTSILERLNAALCETLLVNKLTGLQVEKLTAIFKPANLLTCQQILEYLARSNLFVVPLDDERQWFRYHHLFADLLRARLQYAFSPEKIADLHKVAAGWYEQHGFYVEAVNHLLTAQDFDGAARLIGQNADQILTRGELVTLMQWTEALPADVIWLHPPIIIAKVWALTLAGAVRQVEPLLQQAEAQYEVDNEAPTRREIAGFAAAIRAFFAMMAGDDARALELAERAETLLPESSIHARWLLPYTLGAAYRGQGQYEKAAEAFARQVRMGEEHDNLVVWGTGVTGVALVRLAQGRLNEAGKTCRQALQRLSELGASQFGSLAKLETPLVEVLREQNELEEAHKRLTGVIARMQNWPMPTDRLHAQLTLIKLQMAQGDLPGAFETLRTAQDLKASHSVLMNLARSVDLCEIRLTLGSGDIAGADRLMDALQPGMSRWVELRDQELLLLARLRLAQGNLEEADRILSPLASDAETNERRGTLIETLILKGRILHEQGKGETALGVLIKALAWAEPEGFVQVFIDEGDVIQQLLAGVVRQLAMAADPAWLPSKAYVAKLLDAFPESPTPGVQPPTIDQAAGLVEQLTPRELEVLQLIAAGDSNRAVAEKLVITVSAVKKHTANIYGKLNVNSRTQAVARARQLGLLPTNG